MRHERRKSGRSFTGPVLDEAAGLNPNTRRAWRDRGFFESKGEQYSLEDVLRAAARGAVVRYGIASPGTTKILAKAIVEDISGRIDSTPTEPRFLVMCPLPDPNLPGPVTKRLISGDLVAFSDGEGALCIARDLSRSELVDHFSYIAASAFVLDTAGLARKIMTTLAKHDREDSAP